MRLVLDFAAFTADVDFGDGDVVPLRRPTLRQWCLWQSQHERAGEVEQFDPDSAESSLAADLNLAILTAHLVRPPSRPLDLDHPVWLALHDRHMTSELLTFWRDYPLSPWVNAAPESDEPTGDTRLITSTLPGSLGARAVLYKALSGTLTPAAVDDCELWQLAVLLGIDDVGARSAAPGERAVDELDDGGRITRHGNRETRSWRRKPGAPFLFSAPQRS